MRSRVLLVDEDGAMRTRIRRCLEPLDLDFFEARSSSEALPLLREHAGPWIVLWDFEETNQSEGQLCKQIRDSVTHGPPPYLFFMSHRATHYDVARTIRAGADEFLHKPVAPDLLRSRVKAARRLLGRPQDPATRITHGLEDGIAHGSGELIVRDRSRVFRVLFHRHRVAYVADSGDTVSLRKVLARQGLAEEDVTAAMSEARRSGMSFFEVLTAWGLTDAEPLRELTKNWLRSCFERLLRCRDPQLLFVPKEFQQSSDAYSFDLSEVLPDPPLEAEGQRPSSPISILPPPTPLSSWQNAIFHETEPHPTTLGQLHRIMEIEGAKSAALIHRKQGRCEAWVGLPLRPEVVWPALQTLSGLLEADEAPDELVLTTASTFHLVRALDPRCIRVCYLIVARTSSNLGFCRAIFAKECGNFELESSIESSHPGEARRSDPQELQDIKHAER